MNAAALVDITINSCATRLQDVRPRVREAAEDVGFDEGMIQKLVLVVDEAIANVIRHAYQGDNCGEIRLIIDCPDGNFRIRVRDYAEPVDASCIQPRDLSECRPGGLGINIIDSVMDSWAFVQPQDGEGNVLEMTIAIDGGEIMNECSSRTEAEFRIVSVNGEVDLSWSSDIRKEVLDALAEGSAVLVDLSGVSYIDSSGIAALVEGYQTAKGKSVKFGLVAISDPVRAVLELARLDQVFPIFADLEAARA